MGVGRIPLGCALAALSAACLTLAFAPFDGWWLVWVALVPMVVAHERVLPARWAALAPAIGIGGFLAGYFGGVFPERAAWYMRALPLLVAALILAGGRGGRAARTSSEYRWWPLVAAVGWVAMEMVRLFIPALATWGYLGYALYRQAWLLQPVRLVGIFGLDLLIALVNYALAMAVIAGLDRRGTLERTRGVPRGARGIFEAPVPIEPRLALRWLGGVAATLALWVAVSLGMRAPGGGSTVRVAALQPGVRRGDVPGRSAARDRVMLDRLAAQTREAATRGARLVVWPEGALGADPAVACAGELGQLARDTGAYLVTGYGVRGANGDRNEAVTVDPRDGFVGRYGKDHPVGFLGGTSVWRGTYPTVATDFGTLATMICADSDFTDTGRRLASRGARIIAVPSADWPAIATKHYTLAVFRALETGAAMVKSEYNLGSAIIDSDGRILASAITPAGSAAVLVADVALRDGAPLATRLGDWVGWLCLFARVGRMLLGWRARLASRRRSDG